MKRICKKCGVEKILQEDFYAYKTKKGTLCYGYSCKACEIKVKTQWNQTNRDRCIQYEKKRIEKRKLLTPEERRQLREPERIRARIKRATDLEYYLRKLENTKQWRQNHREEYLLKSQIYSNNRRARKINQSGEFTKTDWLEICYKHDYICAICQQPKPLTVDHIIPLSKGGLHDKHNIQPLCLRCNKKKHAYLPDQLIAIFGAKIT